MKLILITGWGVGKSFLAQAMLKMYADMPVKVALKTLGYETREEAAAAIAKAESSGIDVLILVSRPDAKWVGIEPWQTIAVSGGRPIFEAGPDGEVDADSVGKGVTQNLRK